MKNGESKQSHFGRIVAWAAIGVGLVGLMVVLAMKVMPIVMPKMMAWMMPRMMQFMEEAEVEPPCAQILKRYFEAQQNEAPMAV